MNQIRRSAALLLAAVMSVTTSLGAAAAQEPSAAPLTVQQKQEELDFLCKTLEERHPNLYANVSQEAFQQAKEEVAQKLGELDDLAYNIAVSCLVAQVGDSHTSVSITRTQGVEALPFAVEDFEGKWILARLGQEHAAYLGAELTAINGHPIAEVEKALASFAGHDNDIRPRYRFPGNVYIASLLAYFGIVPETGDVPLTVRTQAGKEETFSLGRYGLEDGKDIAWVRLAERRKSVPKTTRDASRNYWVTALNPKTLYIQYNSCMEDPNLPMKEFDNQVDGMLDKGYYSKVAVDLRGNGGGSDGLLVPLIFRLQEYEKQTGVKIYCLIGERTFSSALTNAVELDVLANAVVVGTPSGGSVNHFGSVHSFTLPYSGIEVRHSSKYIDLDAFMAGEPMIRPKPTKTYGAGPLMPEVAAGQTLADYLEGRDTAVEWILQEKV